MSQLQKLLDEKWPLAGLDKQDTYVADSYRQAFLDGYEMGLKAAEKMITGVIEKTKKELNLK